MKKNLIVAATLLFSSLIHAQSSDTLSNVTVTATKFPIKQDLTGKVVTIINQETIQRNQGKSLTELLNTQASVFIAGANNTLGSNQELYFRGASTGNLLILIDGIPVYDPSQNSSSPIDINNIHLSQIERIEILKGSQSTLWGSNAVAGVINIITKKGGTKTFTPNASLSYGSDNTFLGNIGLNGKIKNFNYNINYAHTSSKGISSAYDSIGNKNFDDDGFKQNNLQVNLGYKIANHWRLEYSSMYSKYNADVDAGAFADDQDFTIQSSNNINALKLNYQNQKTNIALTQSFINSNRTYEDDSTHMGGFGKWSYGKYKGNTAVTELYGKHNLSDYFSFLVGGQALFTNMSQVYKSISAWGPYDAIPLGKDSTKMNSVAGYASLLLSNLKGFNTELGIRTTHNSKYGANTTFTFNPSYFINDATKVFLNISSGYREPSLYQMYSEYKNPTTTLKPEKSNNIELGVQSNFNDQNSWLRFVAFKRDIKDLLIFYTDAQTYASYYMNQSEQHDYGFEIESNIGLNKMGSWNNNISYVDGEGDNNGVKINNLYRRPNFTFNSSLVLTPISRLTINPSFRFVGKRIKGLYDAGAPIQSQYYTVNIYAGYAINNQIKLYTDFRNITNQTYFDTPGYNAKKFNFMAGINFSL
ncbi:MAG: TonB-dependent receptor [Chitinophagaceae bacterium]|nr:MAG: TonB-dependent receptor [Chitinophagaceae bacterium]